MALVRVHRLTAARRRRTRPGSRAKVRAFVDGSLQKSKEQESGRSWSAALFARQRGRCCNLSRVPSASGVRASKSSAGFELASARWWPVGQPLHQVKIFTWLVRHLEVSSTQSLNQLNQLSQLALTAWPRCMPRRWHVAAAVRLLCGQGSSPRRASSYCARQLRRSCRYRYRSLPIPITSMPLSHPGRKMADARSRVVTPTSGAKQRRKRS